MSNRIRRVILDTEGTGLTREDRVIELAMVETIGYEPTGRTWLSRFNPEGHPIHWAARKAHGIRDRELTGQPLFRSRVDEILDFLEDSPVIVHNAPYDLRMVNGELKRARRPEFASGRFTCSLAAARRMFPGEQCGIDGLVARLMPGTPPRGTHDALGDCLLLARLLPLFMDQAPQASARAQSRPEFQGGIPAFGEGVSEALREAMETVRNDRQAFALRVGGSDAWSRIPAVALRPVADLAWGAGAVEDGMRGLSEKRREAALRWMCRGLRPDLSRGREAIAQVEYDRQPLDDDSPSP